MLLKNILSKSSASILLFLILSNVFILSTSAQVESFTYTEGDDVANPATSIDSFDSAIVIQDVEIVGNQLVSKDVILEAIRSKKGTKFSRRAIAYDLKALDNLGYFEKDKLIAIPVPQGEEGVVLRIQVIENMPITGLIIKDNNSIPREKIEEILTPLVGMPRSTTQIRKAVEKIESIYHDNGLLLAAVSELHFDPDGYLTVSIDEGDVDEIRYIGNTKTKEDYLRKILPDIMKDSENNFVYDEKLIAAYMEGLQKSGFFKDVKREITTSPRDPGKHVLTFAVEEQRTKSLSFGTGLGTLNGFFGNVGFEEPNFRGKGEKVSFIATGGTGVLTALDGDTQSRYARKGNFQFSANYADPFFLDKDNLAFSSNAQATQLSSYKVDSSIERSLSTGFAFSKRLENHKNWSVTNGLNLSMTNMQAFGPYARVTLENSLMSQEGMNATQAASEAASIRNEQLSDGYYLDYTPSLIYRKIDETGTGWKNTIFGGPSIGIGGVNSYLGAGFDVKRLDRLTDKGTFFKDNFYGNALFGDPSGFRKLKVGGPYGARGYRQFLDSGIGNYMIGNTAELAIPIPDIKKNPIKDTKIIFWNDLGMVLGEERLNDLYNRESVIASFGVGLEVNIPMMGPMRIDYGIPLIRPNSKSFWSGRFHINAGNQL